MTMNLTTKQVFNMSEADFGDYLAGLIEGDGHINQHQIIIIFHGTHGDVAKKLKLVLGGSVTKGPTQSWRYVLSHKAGLDRVLKLTRSRWIGPFKTNQILHHNLEQAYDFALSHQTLTATKPNFWHVGFTDADGCFDIQIRRCQSSRLKLRVDLRLT